MKRYPLWEKELYALITALREWRFYCNHQDTTIYTSHKGLSHLLHPLIHNRNLNSRQARWIDNISRYKNQLQWTPGSIKHNHPFAGPPPITPTFILNAISDEQTTDAGPSGSQ